MLVLHGFANNEALLRLAAKVGAAGASNLRDALRHLHREISFVKPDEVEVGPVASALLKLYDAGRVQSSDWEEMIDALEEETKLKGKKLLFPLRLALTGQRKGQSLSEILQLLELMNLGAPWGPEILPLEGRMAALRKRATETLTEGPKSMIYITI